MSQLTETITFDVRLEFLQNNELQDFTKKLEQSQHVIIYLDEYNESISITGKQTSINTAQAHIKGRIDKIEKNLTTTPKTPPTPRQSVSSNHVTDPIVTLTTELNVARSNFLALSGEKHLTLIRKSVGITDVTFANGQLQFSGQANAIKQAKLRLEQSLYEETISIPLNVKDHLTKTSSGRLLKEFSKKYRVGTSLQPYQRNQHKKKNTHQPSRGKNPRANLHTVNHQQQSNDHTQHHTAFRGNSRARFPRARGNFNANPRPTNNHTDLFNSSSNLDHSEENQSTKHNPFKSIVKTVIDDSDDDDNNNSQDSDSDTSSLSSTMTSASIVSNKVNILTEIILCSDDILRLQEAKEELENSSLYSETWALTADEYLFIFKQKYRGQDQPANMSNQDRCSRIKYYLCGLVKSLSVFLFVFYKRGMWYITGRGFKSDVSPAILRIKNHLRNIVKTEIRMTISKLVALFIQKKALATIKELNKNHNINIQIDFPSNDQNKQDDAKHSLTLSGSISGIHTAQSAVQEFLNDLLEKEYDIARPNGNLPIGIRTNLLQYMKKIEESENYDAISYLNFHRSPTEQTGTKNQLTLTVVSTNEDIAKDILQQCKDIIEGYDEWIPTLNEYQTLVNIFFVQKSLNIEQFQKDWNAQIYLDKEKHTVKISARSKMVAQEIREVLQNSASGGNNRTDRISVTIPIDLNVRRFANQKIQPKLDEAKSKRIYIDTRNREELTLSGRKEDVLAIEKSIRTIVNDIKQKLIINHLSLSIAQSELFRNNSYDIPRRIERETETVIRDMKFTKTQSAVLPTNDIDNTISTLKCVVNQRGQKIIVKKGEISKINDVDAFINFHSHSLAQNLLNKPIIHINAPKSRYDRRQDRSSLVFAISSALQDAEKDKYTSVALPSIYTHLSDCPKTTIITIKQFFADYPTSHLNQILLIDSDQSLANAFAVELLNEHINEIKDRQIPSATPKWSWQDNTKEVSYNDEDARQIEAEFQRYLRTFIQTDFKLTVNQARETITAYYLIQFDDTLEEDLESNPNALNERWKCGYQTNMKTKFKRNIIRYPFKQDKQSKSNDRKSLDIYEPLEDITTDDWQIIGMTSSSTKQALTEMKKVVQAATITERFAVNLSQNTNIHEKTIKDIAIQNLAQVNFERDRTGKLTIVLDGLRQNISQAKLEILSYTNDIISSNTIEDKDDELTIPKEWIEQDEECLLVRLYKGDAEFTRIERRINETMSDVKIHTIERIQNVRLWNQYVFQRRTLQQTLTHKSNEEIEMELFHGTRKTPPDEIYNGDCGFDMRFSTNGLWGIGSYFAKNASYSCRNYSYELPDGKRQVFVAYVLVGDTCDYGTKNDPALRMPPKKDPKLSKTLYNSVSGETGGSRVYVVYDNRLTYPAYLITFTS